MAWWWTCGGRQQSDRELGGEPFCPFRFLHFVEKKRRITKVADAQKGRQLCNCSSRILGILPFPPRYVWLARYIESNLQRLISNLMRVRRKVSPPTSLFFRGRSFNRSALGSYKTKVNDVRGMANCVCSVNAEEAIMTLGWDPCYQVRVTDHLTSREAAFLAFKQEGIVWEVCSTIFPIYHHTNAANHP